MISGFEDPYKKEATIEKKDKQHYEEEYDMTLAIVGVIVLLVIIGCIVMLIVRKHKSGKLVDRIATSTFEDRTKGKPVPLINDDES